MADWTRCGPAELTAEPEQVCPGRRLTLQAAGENQRMEHGIKKKKKPQMSKYVLKFARPYLHTKCVKKKKNGKMLHDPNDGNIALTEIHNSKYRYIYKVKNTTKICY